MKKMAHKLFKTTFWPRMILVFLCTLIITYLLLWLGLRFSSYLLFFTGAIAGGLWGVFWQMLFSEDNPVKKLLTRSPYQYIIIEIVLVVVLIFLVKFYPLDGLI